MITFFAYLDPGTGSLVLQAFVAGFAGLAVAGKYGVRWLKRRFTGTDIAAPPIQALEKRSAGPNLHAASNVGDSTYTQESGIHTVA